MSDAITITNEKFAQPAVSMNNGRMVNAGPETFGALPAQPTQEAVDGIRFDFCAGLRVQFPAREGYRITFRDLDTGNVVYHSEVQPNAVVASVKKFFVRWGFEITRRGETAPVFVHEYNAAGRDVMIQLPIGTLGDSIAWFSYVERFQQWHGCRILCVMTPEIAGLFRKQYPEIEFISQEETRQYHPYACYYLGLFFHGDVDHQPVDFRYAGLHHTAGRILGLPPADCPPRLDLSAKRRIPEKYVCIAAQASSQAKYWNNPSGWIEVVKFLKDNGYRVLCIDKERIHGAGIVWNHIPYGAEDFTGALPLQERVDLIKDADFFIGLSSGLSWLAWACRVPVVMISGFTAPENEFYTPYRVINFQACNSCWNDTRVDFDHFDFLWCPRRKGTDRHFECSKAISAEQVIRQIRQIPEFRPAT